MFTSIDKALAAFIMSGVYILNQTGFVSIPSQGVETALVFITPILVWAIPNKARK